MKRLTRYGLPLLLMAAWLLCTSCANGGREGSEQAPLLTVSGAVTQTVTAEALAALPAAGDGETQGFSLTELMRLLGVPYYSRVTLTGDTGEPVEIYGYGLFTLRDGAALDYSGGMELDPDVTGVTAMDIGTEADGIIYITQDADELAVAAELLGFTPLTLDAAGWTPVGQLTLMSGTSPVLNQMWEDADGRLVSLRQYRSDQAQDFAGEAVDLNGTTAWLLTSGEGTAATPQIALCWSVGDLHYMLNAPGDDRELLLALAAQVQ